MADLSRLIIKDDHLRSALIEKSLLLLDGAMGTMLQSRGLTENGEVPDLLNLSHPDEIVAIHRAYVDAGAEVVTTNTFGANALKLGSEEKVFEVYRAAAENARAAGARYIAGDIGPTGALLEPLGTLGFEDAFELFAMQVKAIVAAGCDLIIIETQTDLLEAKAAVLAAKRFSKLPIFVSMSFGEDGRTFLGTPPEVAAITFSALGVQAVGLNCSLGPEGLLPLAKAMKPYLRCPLLVKPNAGLPHVREGKTVYDVSPSAYGEAMGDLIDAGATILGGCCGTTPDHIAALARRASDASSSMQGADDEDIDEVAGRLLALASSTKAVTLDPHSYDILIIGENINPTRRKALKQALIEENLDAVVGEALLEESSDADVIDVNVGVPGIDEARMMDKVVSRLQSSVTAPLQIDSSDADAIEVAVRHYSGKPIINSVNGKPESLSEVLPIAAKYGCAVIGLTLDEHGIPKTAEERLRIARNIIDEAAAHGIPKQDIAIDCLAMTAATNQAEVKEIFKALKLIKEALGVATVLGVSNISFGLPSRSLINSTFLAAAVGAGLNMPIINPCSESYREVVSALRVLNGQDAGSIAFIEQHGPEAGEPQSPFQNDQQGAVHPKASDAKESFSVPLSSKHEAHRSKIDELVGYLLMGRPQPAAASTTILLEAMDPLPLIDEVFVPVLDEVGRRYEAGKSFLPQLIASAEAVQAGFQLIRSHGDVSAAPASNRQKVLVATVKGDIHDIGKNIVSMLLENYGFDVIDLGFDVDPETILSTAKEMDIKLIGLSALMTTTVKAMEETIALIHSKLPEVKVMVGGAVLTPEYATSIGADFYSKDAAEAARIAQSFFSQS